MSIDSRCFLDLVHILLLWVFYPLCISNVYLQRVCVSWYEKSAGMNPIFREIAENWRCPLKYFQDPVDWTYHSEQFPLERLSSQQPHKGRTHNGRNDGQQWNWHGVNNWQRSIAEANRNHKITSSHVLQSGDGSSLLRTFFVGHLAMKNGSLFNNKALCSKHCLKYSALRGFQPMGFISNSTNSGYKWAITDH